MYYFRLDDASEYMNVNSWRRVELLFDQYDIKPLVGVIPNNADQMLVNKYKIDVSFWERVRFWQKKGWTIALHGYSHQFCSNSGGINPVNQRSEFADLPIERQREKIRSGVAVMAKHNIFPRVFFAPGHTYDENTIEALRMESNIRIISDTFAHDVYYERGFFFAPVQSGVPRRLIFRTSTICLHPNNMTEREFQILEDFLNKYQKKMASFRDLPLIKRDRSLYDKLLSKGYFLLRKIRRFIR